MHTKRLCSSPGRKLAAALAVTIMANERVIKKYANRRLYDSTGSRHVTLDDLRKMIVSGDKVKVSTTSRVKILTRAVLLQVIAEQEQFGTPVLSIELLESIIRFYGNPVQEMLTRYMEQSVGSLVRQQQVMRAEMAKVLEGPMAPIDGIRAPEHGTVGEDSGIDDGGIHGLETVACAGGREIRAAG